jgi:hypothetical protein
MTQQTSLFAELRRTFLWNNMFEINSCVTRNVYGKKYEYVSVYVDRSTGRYIAEYRTENINFYIYSSHSLSRSTILPLIYTEV